MTPADHDRVLHHLDTMGAAYEVVPCDPEYADTAAFCARYGYSLAQSANTILVASKKEPRKFAACVVLATTRLDVNRTVRSLMGVRKASFASPDDTRTVTGMTIGGVTPFGLPDDVPLYIDGAVMEVVDAGYDGIILGGGSRSIKVMCDPEVLTSLPNAAVVQGLANPLDG